ncbi:MAG: mechanosensitive ion channel family protein [Clostridiales bacterium]|nr:mechanosensitive ion channel family protein [Clostridiales bacterium]
MKINMKESITLFFTEYQKYINIVLGILLFAFLTVFRKKLASLILNITAKIVFMKKPENKDAFVSSLMRPLSIYFVLLGIFCGIYINYKHSALLSSFKILSVLIACWAITSFVSDNLLNIMGYKNTDTKVNGVAVKFISNILKVLTVCIGLVMVISELGYNINGLITGLGVGGLAVSLAAQDSLKNLISGFVIMFDKPFDVGDFISTADFSGVVEDITMRSTRIRKDDDTVIIVPNCTISDSLVTNFAKLTRRLVEFKIGLLYSTPEDALKKCEKEIYDFLNNHEMVEKDYIRVCFAEFEDSALNLQIRCYINTTDLEEYYKFIEEFNFKIKNIVNGNNTDFAYPSRSIYIEKSENEKD